MKPEIAHVNKSFDLEAQRKGPAFPIHEDRERTWFAGWVCEDGVAAFGLKTDRNRSDYYSYATEYSSKDTDYLGAYIEFPLSDTEFDIVSEICDEQDPLALYHSVVHYAGEELQVPEDHVGDWDKIGELICNTENKDNS